MANNKKDDMELINYEDRETLRQLKELVAKDATPEEFELFKHLCRATKLNPYKREIWFVKTGNPGYEKVQIMVGVNGYHAIANSHPQYDGTEIVYSPEVVVIGEFKGQKLNPPVVAHEWIEARVHRKDRKYPSTFKAYWREYSQDLLSKYNNRTVWAKLPTPMLLKCAESLALRKAFSQELNGTYSDVEMPEEYQAPINVTPQKEEIKKEEVVEEAPLQTHYYEIKGATDKQVAFMVAQGCRPVEGTEIWESNVKLGGKLEQYAVIVNKEAK